MKCQSLFTLTENKKKKIQNVACCSCDWHFKFKSYGLLNDVMCNMVKVSYIVNDQIECAV